MQGFGGEKASSEDSDPATFEPNEATFWKAVDRVSITVSSKRLVENGGAEGEAEDSQVKEVLRAHLSRKNRLFDILCFKRERGLPLFEVSSRLIRKKHPIIPMPNGEVAHATQGALELEHSPQEKGRVLTKISDLQGRCIVSLRPTLLYPMKGENSFVEAELVKDSQGNCCAQNRNRKTLGNYKNTGFCQYHVFGSEMGSEENWRVNDCKTVRGFNLQRKKGETKLRHMLCLEMDEGKVFLKWCTQCHLWKNLNEFCSVMMSNPEDPSPGIDTFCGNCYERQVKSREKQLQKRRNEKKTKMASDAIQQGGGVAITHPSDPSSVVEQAREVIQDAAQPHAAQGVNGLPVAGDVPMGGVSAVDAPKTPEISEQQKLNGEVVRNGAATTAEGGQLSTTARSSLQHHAGNNCAKKKTKRKHLEVSPEEAKRLRAMQLEYLNSIPVTDFSFWYPNEQVFVEGLDSVKVDKMTLREYYESPTRVGDILFFPFDKIPDFVEENNPIPKRGNLSEIIERERSQGKVYHPNLRVSDNQKVCINSLGPMLMFPNVDQETGEKGWRFVTTKSDSCCNVRSTSEAKKKLENYKFTGFCSDCVKGDGQASYQSWIDANCASIRGFNLNRKKVDHRLRHLLCLESKDGKVFLKWCTQCHTWKNFASYISPENKCKLNTFCAICHRRQMVSRKMQSEARKPAKVVVPADNGVFHAANGNGSA